MTAERWDALYTAVLYSQLYFTVVLLVITDNSLVMESVEYNLYTWCGVPKCSLGVQCSIFMLQFIFYNDFTGVDE
jgi:hypothetical protein